jgi:uncharacterized membrane protein HdeD (DUF308 family)
MAITARFGQHAGVVAVEGVVSVLFGLAAVLWPGLTLATLVLFFGVFAIVDGIVALVNLFVCVREHRPWWPSLLLGIVGIAAGGFILSNPGISAVVAAYVIAFWAIASGVMMVAGSLVSAEFLYLLAGALSVVFGLILLGNPVAGALALVFVIGCFAIIRGILLLFDAVRPGEMQHMTA